MNPAVWLLTFCSLMCILTGCTNTNSSLANDPLGTGPFDANGNYREDWADDPSKWRKPGSRSQPTRDEVPTIAKNEEPPPNANPLAPKTTPTPSVTPKPQPKVVAAPKPKPKPKPKPTVTRYTVKKGDSLSRIASRNGSSVSAIQRANGIKGTLIHPGQSLIIPKR